MGLTMGQRKAVTKAIATRYRRASKADKGKILDELCAMTGWHRNHARKALVVGLKPTLVRPARRPRTPVYGPEVLVALRFCWAVLGAPTGKRLAPVMAELVATLRRFGELDITDELAALLVVMSPATMDRRLAPARAAMTLRGRSHTKPGSLLKSQIPIRTWAQWDDAVPGFVEIDLVGHEGGNAEGEHAYTLTVTDIATGWTENRSVQNKAQKWVVAALQDIAKIMPFPLLGVDSDNGSEFMGYHRYDTPAELLLLNKIWVLQSLMTNYFLPQQKLVSKVRDGAKVTKKYDRPTTPYRRAKAHPAVSEQDKTIMESTLGEVNPAAVQRQIQALTAELLTLTTTKAAARSKPQIQPTTKRASVHESTNRATRAS
jgi:hypothetical protein